MIIYSNIAKTLGCDIYFAKTYRRCDRELSEYTNDLIRRHPPKGADFANINEKLIEHVQDLLNNKPRKSLGFLTPNKVIKKYWFYYWNGSKLPGFRSILLTSSRCISSFVIISRAYSSSKTDLPSTVFNRS